MAKKVRKQYAGPLPIVISTSVYGSLPEIYPHNPLSWVYFLYNYVKILTKPVPQSAIPNIQVEYEDGIYKVKNPPDMQTLWDYGFFGKGNLSRSDPSYGLRTIKRLHLPEGQESTGLTSEEITKLRRLERVQFKKERSRESELHLKRRQGVITEPEEKELAEIKHLLMEFRKSNRIKLQQEQATPIPFNELRPEDQLLVDEESMSLKPNLEYLQLQDVETVFLKFLDVIDVLDGDTRLELDQLIRQAVASPLQPNDPLLIQYVVYHHYRSLGWSVRSGVKFGCDYILYKKGPPFSHAEHAIVIQATDKSIHKSLTDLHTISRVIGSVKKNLVMTYVEPPDVSDQFNEWSRQMDAKNFKKILQSYKVYEVNYRRWIPNRTRD